MKTPLRALIIVGIIGSMLGGYVTGHEFGYMDGRAYQIQRDINATDAYFKRHDEATVFETKDHRAISLVQDNVCIPFPDRVPLIHRSVTVSPDSEPCAYGMIRNYIQPVTPGSVIHVMGDENEKG